MPRKADERGFGFRKKGLLRILANADAEQVLLAVEDLGFRLPDRAPIEGLVELFMEVHGTTEEIIAGFFLDMIEILVDAIHQVPNHDEELALRTITQFRARQEAMLVIIKNAREVIWERVDEVYFQIGAV